MRAYRVEATISRDGALQLAALPFRKGERVEVIVLERRQEKTEAANPLKGSVLRFNDPTEPVATHDFSRKSESQQ